MENLWKEMVAIEYGTGIKKKQSSLQHMPMLRRSQKALSLKIVVLLHCKAVFLALKTSLALLKYPAWMKDFNWFRGR